MMRPTFAKLCLLALGAIGIGMGAPRSAPQATPINIVATEYKFTPDHLTLTHGAYYRLHLENHGTETHEFTAPTFFASAHIDNPDVLNRERSEILLQPGDAKDVFLTAPAPGTYDLRCADHDWAGMVGGITVE